MTADAALWLEQILAAIDEGQAGPTPEDLATAPMLSPWHPILTLEAEPLLWGHVSDHPILGTRWITTSRLIALDPGNRWARTVSRWYRLDQGIGQPPADPEEVDASSQFHGDMARLTADAARLGFLPVGNRTLLDRLLTAFIVHLRAHRDQAAADRAARH